MVRTFTTKTRRNHKEIDALAQIYLHLSFIPSAICFPHCGAKGLSDLYVSNLANALSFVAQASVVGDPKNCAVPYCICAIMARALGFSGFKATAFPKVCMESVAYCGPRDGGSIVTRIM